MLVTVASFTEPWEAPLFRLRLEAEGIPATVAHEHHIWAMWPYGLALGGVKVQVPAAEEDKARAVEARCRAGDYQAELETEMGPLDAAQCPRCGSAHIADSRPVPMMMMLIAAWLCADVVFPVRASRHRCEDCGSTWKDRSEPRPTDSGEDSPHGQTFASSAKFARPAGTRQKRWPVGASITSQSRTARMRFAPSFSRRAASASTSSVSMSR
jgi:hypothetical protein